MRETCIWALWMGVLAALSADRATAADAHPVVAGFERFYTGDKADLAQGGQLLLGELNCVSCHQPAGPAVKKQAPVLDDVAARVRLGYLRKYLGDPHGVKPGGTMPNLFAGDPDKDSKVESLVHFLASTGVLKQERPDIKSQLLGRDLYSKIGCFACHGPRDLVGQPDKNLPSNANVIPLGDLKAKYSIPGLTAFLTDPLKVRPAGRMPHLLVAKDARDVANYLLQGIKVTLPTGIGATKWNYYEGSWNKLPDLAKMKSKGNGAGNAFDISVAKRGSEFAFRFEGYIKFAAAGEYTFTLHSDDGSRLFIDGQKIVDNDGIHPPASVSGKATLRKEDPHWVVVEFMNGGGGAELVVEIEGRGLARQPLAAHIAPTIEALNNKPVVTKIEDQDAFEIKADLVAKGRDLFTSVGCANCHQLNENKKPLASKLSAPKLVDLKAGGCLVEKPAKGVPDYDLSAKQRAAIEVALKSPPTESKDPSAVIAKTMMTLNCYVCHSRDNIGGPTEELNKFFLTVQPEMGDEGRVPPSLDGVGAKLNADYFNQILDKGTHDRPYMHTRMPGFGNANVGHLQALFASLDKVPAVTDVNFAFTDPKVKSSGRHMIGEQALSCIKCHTFNGVKAEGIQGIDMTLIPKRINRDWFHFYVRDPQKYRPGTRMPSAFLNDMSPLPQVLDGKVATQIEAMWVYLKQGKDAALPLGMGKKSIPLFPLKDAIIYRNFIQGAGPRAIGVGYPEKTSLAFDANDMRLAMIWQGAFIDAAKHWTDRGSGFEGPLGDNVLALPSGAPFAVLSKVNDDWPKTPARQIGYKFIGYKLAPDERPTFEYSLNGVKIEDFPNGVKTDKEPTIKRVLTLSSASTVDGLYYRAAVGSRIEATSDGWYKIDSWKTKLESAGAPIIRESGGKKELLAPVKFIDGKATISQEYVW